MSANQDTEIVIEAAPVVAAAPVVRGVWSFRDVDSGAFTGRTFRGSSSHLAANTPPGCVAVPGDHASEPEARQADPAAEARLRRARLLSACDWVVTKATETGQPVPQAWASYRQALRDVPLQAGFPDTIEWPVRPE